MIIIINNNNNKNNNDNNNIILTIIVIIIYNQEKILNINRSNKMNHSIEKDQPADSWPVPVLLQHLIRPTAQTYSKLRSRHLPCQLQLENWSSCNLARYLGGLHPQFETGSTDIFVRSSKGRLSLRIQRHLLDDLKNAVMWMIERQQILKSVPHWQYFETRVAKIGPSLLSPHVRLLLNNKSKYN